ncbi:terpene synthase family protein [Streptomyces natalensis]|uniref:Terpene synthase n=1 Tax=Streptomyces natalensis ATCC 27448 TaxID=1240678 RepID=A0A0D7CNN9_9ACTN|nr:terpene synthase family protein [Streptomyces natalensis]KIZ17849.1 hypothetical protein SNA_11320 [Streptomyces natalensis ATCC 27448]
MGDTQTTAGLSDLIARWRRESQAVEDLMPWVRSRMAAVFSAVEPVPEHDPFDENMYRWGMSTGVYSAVNAHELAAMQCGLVVRRCMPNLPDQAREPVAMYLIWITAVDDGMVDHGSSLDEVAAVADGVLRRGETTSESPTARAMADLRRTLLERGGTDLLPILADLVGENLEAFRRKQTHLREDRLPPLNEYVALRGLDDSIRPMVAMHQWFLSPTSAEGAAATLLDELNRLAGQLGGLVNDLLGLPADLARPEFMNVVFALAQDYQVSLVTACRAAVAVVETLHERAEWVCNAIRTLPDGSPALVQQAEAALYWPDVLHLWTSTGSRHSPEHAYGPTSVRTL